MSKNLDLLFAGFGGQGALFAGKLVAYAGLFEEREVSWFPSYGPEMRGGTANVSVCLSDEPVGSPLVLNPDVLIALNQPSFDKFKDSIKKGGMAIVDSTMVKDVPEIEGVTVFEVPATGMGEQDSTLKGMANVILTGKLFSETKCCEKESLLAAVEKCVPARKQAMVAANKEALLQGMQA